MVRIIPYEGNDTGSIPVTSTIGTRNRCQLGMTRWLMYFDINEVEYKKVRSRRCFAAHLFVLFLRKVWADGAQEAVYGQ